MGGRLEAGGWATAEPPDESPPPRTLIFLCLSQNPGVVLGVGVGALYRPQEGTQYGPPFGYLQEVSRTHRHQPSSQASDC